LTGFTDLISERWAVVCSVISLTCYDNSKRNSLSEAGPQVLGKAVRNYRHQQPYKTRDHDVFTCISSSSGRRHTYPDVFTFNRKELFSTR